MEINNNISMFKRRYDMQIAAILGRTCRHYELAALGNISLFSWKCNSLRRWSYLQFGRGHKNIGKLYLFLPELTFIYYSPQI